MCEDKLIEIYCQVDDFCKQFLPSFEQSLLEDGSRKRRVSRSLEMSEILSIYIFYHHCRFRNFKYFYQHFVRVYLRSYFPGLVSYSRFIQWTPDALVVLMSFVLQRCLGESRGTQYIDSCALVVSHNRRISQHKTFKGLARRGKTSVGWFFGFKLHLIINDLGEIVAFMITPANVSDVNHALVEKLSRNIWGQLFGDKGYISKKLKNKLKERGIELITKLRKNMKKQLLPMMERIKLAQRSAIECTIDALKNQAYVEHSRHRSFGGMITNILSAIAAFHFQDRKPKPRFDFPFLTQVEPKFLLD